MACAESAEFRLPLAQRSRDRRPARGTERLIHPGFTADEAACLIARTL